MLEQVLDIYTNCPKVSPSEAAQLMAGENPIIYKQSDASEEAQSLVGMYAAYFRNSVFSRASEKVDAVELWALAYLVIGDKTPDSIKEHCEQCLVRLARRNGGRERIFKLGAEPLKLKADHLRSTGRGEHRKKDFAENNLKLMGLLTTMLVDSKSQSGAAAYGTKEKPNLSAIHRAMEAEAERLNVSKDGLGQSTVLEKLGVAVKQLKHSELDS